MYQTFLSCCHGNLLKRMYIKLQSAYSLIIHVEKRGTTDQYSTHDTNLILSYSKSIPYIPKKWCSTSLWKEMMYETHNFNSVLLPLLNISLISCQQIGPKKTGKRLKNNMYTDYRSAYPISTQVELTKLLKAPPMICNPNIKFFYIVLMQISLHIYPFKLNKQNL